MDKLMIEKRISNGKMGLFVGTTDTMVGHWRKGEAMPKADKLSAIADCLGCSVDYLLDRSDVVNAVTESPPPEEAKLLDRFRRLDDDGREEVLHCAMVELRRVNAERGEEAEAVG